MHVAKDSKLDRYLKGMCLNESRKLTWSNGADLDLYPLPVVKKNLMDLEESVHLELTVDSITEAEDFLIFSAWRDSNVSMVLDLIDQHRGINSVDEYGQTILMHAVQKGSMEVVSGLLNTRMPKVDVNKAKHVSMRWLA